MVALREAEPPLELFRITDRSTLIGPSLPARWRLSALEVYDGQRWTPGITLRPIGSTLGAPSPARPDVPPSIEFEVEVLSDDIALVPIPGRPLRVETGSEKGVETDLGRTVVRLAEDPQPGLTIDASAETAPVAAVSRAASLGTRQVDDIARGFADVARSLAGEGTVLEQLESIERTMHEEWELDDDAPGGGQQLALLDRFVNDTKRGTREQFASAFVLMSRSLGVNARMATGFIVPVEDLALEAGAPLALRSPHAAVWPEVEVAGRGWLAFDPAPAGEATDDDSPPTPPAAQSPAAAQPPIVPPAERADDDDTTPIEPESETSRWVAVRTWARRVGVVGGVTLLPFLAMVGAIVGMKWSRRRRRLRVQDPARRIAAAWANATDSLVDAGLTIRPAWTNDAIAKEGTVVAPGVPHEMRRLAASATAVTFGEESEDWTRVDDALAAWRSIDAAILAERTRWQRVRWRLSLRSLRRPTRSPVVA
jgi:transglutaminase-like putative cysteine protease